MQRFRLPEVFLGLLSISVSVTASVKEPITANLAQWSLTVRGEAARATGAARRLRREAIAVNRFLGRAGIPDAAITPSVVRSEEIVVRLPHKQPRSPTA